MIGGAVGVESFCDGVVDGFVPGETIGRVVEEDFTQEVDGVEECREGVDANGDLEWAGETAAGADGMRDAGKGER